MSTNLPPTTEKGVFSVNITRDINAPIDKVWEILLDFQSYKEWNPFVLNMTLVSPTKSPLPSQIPAVDKHLIIESYIPALELDPTTSKPIPPPKSTQLIPLKPSQRQTPLEIITHLDNETHRVAWRNIDFPSWLLRAERWQALSVTDSGSTRYETEEVFAGVMAYVLKATMGDALNRSFEAMADALKRRAETV